MYMFLLYVCPLYIFFCVYVPFICIFFLCKYFLHVYVPSCIYFHYKCVFLGVYLLCIYVLFVSLCNICLLHVYVYILLVQVYMMRNEVSGSQQRCISHSHQNIYLDISPAVSFCFFLSLYENMYIIMIHIKS